MYKIIPTEEIKRKIIIKGRLTRLTIMKLYVNKLKRVTV